MLVRFLMLWLAKTVFLLTPCLLFRKSRGLCLLRPKGDGNWLSPAAARRLLVKAVRQSKDENTKTKINKNKKTENRIKSLAFG